MEQFTQIREGLHIDFNVPIKVDDGLVLRANVYRPNDDKKYPVILTYGPYGKDIHFEEIYSTAWDAVLKDCPEVGVGSTNIHQAWELVDPEKWCPLGYICVRVDGRGIGCSPGFFDQWSRREAQDIYDCIEWAAAQPWSTGKIGMNGISYYATNQWHVAELQPPHLAAILCWEGFCDYYRDADRHGGILNVWEKGWFDKQIGPVQYGRGEYGYKSRVTGRNVSSDVTLSSEELMKNRSAHHERELLNHPLDDEFFKYHSTNDFSKIQVPLLSAGNWGGAALHLRGNVVGFLEVGSKEKWLEIHVGEHWTPFYSQEGHDLQQAFLDYYLKGIDNGWKDRPMVDLKIRHVGQKTVQRFENEWPIKRTQYAKYYLDAANGLLTTQPPKEGDAVTYKGMSSEGVTFMSPPMQEEIEFTGHALAKMLISSSTTDADLFLVFRVFTPDMEEDLVIGASDPHTPMGQGWLRASHRKLDPDKTTDYLPWHTHDELWPLTPGEKVEMMVEIHPISIVVPKGYRFALTIRGKDYVYPGNENKVLASNVTHPLTGCGPMMHNDPFDRPAAIFDGDVTIHIDPQNPAYLQLPVIPEKQT